MKQFRLSVAVLLTVWGLAGMGGAVADNGSGVSGVKVVKSEQKKVRLHTEAGQPIDVALIDADGNVLYQGLVSSAKSKDLTLNLNSLPDGQYFLTASTNNWWMSQGLTIQANAVNVDERKLKQIEQPQITTYAKNKVQVVVPATNVEDANVAIFDAQNVPVLTETLNGTIRRYDLSSLPEGSYTFVVGPSEKKFSTRIDIRR
ncbi:hypothetical protein [Fibrisoma limi]|nr:hypothetical protein [Fibrisoma limi]